MAFVEATMRFWNESRPPQDWSEVCDHVITVQYTPVLQKLKESRPLESLVTDEFFSGVDHAAQISLPDWAKSAKYDSLHHDA